VSFTTPAVCEIICEALCPIDQFSESRCPAIGACPKPNLASFDDASVLCSRSRRSKSERSEASTAHAGRHPRRQKLVQVSRTELASPHEGGFRWGIRIRNGRSEGVQLSPAHQSSNLGHPLAFYLSKVFAEGGDQAKWRSCTCCAAIREGRSAVEIFAKANFQTLCIPLRSVIEACDNRERIQEIRSQVFSPVAIFTRRGMSLLGL
jgi:hypothetical protein